MGINYAPTFPPGGINFAGNPCGLEMTATERAMAARLEEIHRGIEGLTKGCFARNAAEKPAALPPQHGARLPAPAAAKSNPGASDITGIPEDKAKAKQ